MSMYVQKQVHWNDFFNKYIYIYYSINFFVINGSSKHVQTRIQKLGSEFTIYLLVCYKLVLIKNSLIDFL